MQYWQERMAKSQAKLTEKRTETIDKQLAKYYRNAMHNTIASFENVLNKVLAQQTAGKQVTPADLYKLDSYWKMLGQLKHELQKLGDKEVALLHKQFVTHYEDIYKTTALPSGTFFSTISTENVEQMINQIWVADGKSWSQRIWENTEKLAETLNEELIHCVATGQKTSRLKELLQERFGVSYSQADSLARTELAHIQTQAAKHRYQDYGIQEVEVLADEDERRCEICGKLHGKRYPIGAQIPIPAHPRCRCAIIPVVED